MMLSEMIIRVRQQIPASGSTGDMQDVTIQNVLNQGVVKVNLSARCYKAEVKVSNVPGQQTYSLSAICPGFLSMEKSGVWWFDANGFSQLMWPKTKRWLDNFLVNWRDQDPTTVPTWYWHDGDELGFQPASTQQSSNANKDFRIQYLLRPTPMGGNNNYPWTNGTTELTALACFDDAIIAYAVSKLAPAVMDKEGRNYYDEQFKSELKIGMAQVKRQLDMTTNFDYYIRPDISSGFLPH